MKIALPSHRGTLVAVAGATSPAKTEIVDALAKHLGPATLTIGTRSHPDPESSIDALAKVDGRAAEDAITIVRMAESAAVRASNLVITARPVLDELARYRAARKIRHEYVQHHVMRRVEDTVAWEAADYDFVVWSRSPFPSPGVRAFEAALSEVLKDLCVPYHSLCPPLINETVERLVASIAR
ncbi:hypothetical protein [Kibdelosporangium aridum]|uniref:Uncharacterized protein n=1 Tax=Kibdelosporangium aridum TaxID=2030 RepID=A0A1W2CYK6_KIBAR|nr:hypothetical protein [Kibdelosporangium aridum]SMC90240.1 hypothetical protein SAMN05661093_02640 [Kibdelosporangium aridum]